MQNTINLVAGARPNFMKLAPVKRAFQAFNDIKARIVHTGQHYDAQMSEAFFRDLGIPEPDVSLNAGSGSHGQQTARILERYEAHLMEHRAAATVVFGDVNSTIACALASVKLGVPVVHVEAGLRSFDRSMPEEINRVLTDAIADLLLVSESTGIENLKREGVDEKKVVSVGNVMIDTLANELPRARDLNMPSRFNLRLKEYGLITLHRPSNVDDPNTLRSLLELFSELSQRLPFVFPMHPRTRQVVQQHGMESLLKDSPRVMVQEPLGYRENLGLMAEAKVVLTDSGGMQEETTYLGVPCLTLRENTERPVTVKCGTSQLVGKDPAKIRTAFNEVMGGRWKKGGPVDLWDGHAGERVAKAIRDWMGRRAPSAIPKVP
jgi:UDP-N-acetylglucosamine 2-epimerase (non-hydrolysing)